MRSHRFYTPIPLEEKISAELPKETVHHCAQVLRYKTNDELTLFNGDGYDYSAVIDQIEKKRCVVTIISKNHPNNESPLKIHLLQGVARGDKMDLIIQKAVELGIAEITPIFTERCNVKLDAKRLDKKIQHWNKTMISACEQSGRAIIPKLATAIPINDLVEEKGLTIYCEPTTKKTFKDLAIKKSIRIVIGPEGGFSEKDLMHLEKIGCVGVKIGPRILRTETSGLAAISILQSHFGDI
jgi:16S rRNA (uracil1498-N3)-methyltransferase